MRVTLNVDKLSMLFLGDPLTFTYDAPGPIEVDLATLTGAQQNQLLYNWRRGVLTVDQPELLKSLDTTLPSAQPTFQTPHEQPLSKPADPMVSMAKAADTTRAELRAILKETMPSIKAKVANLTIAQVKLLLELEKGWKKRKAVMALFEDLVNQHARSVVKFVGPEDVGGKVFDPKAEHLDKEQEVIDYDSEEVVFSLPTDKELEKANG